MDFDEIIENIETILEDADVSSDDAQNCITDLKNLKNEVSEKLNDAERASKKLESEKAEVAKSFETERGRNLVQKEALDFVKEILTSHVVSDKFTVQLYQAIDSIVGFIKEDVQKALKGSGLLRSLSDAERKALFSTDLEAWAITKKKKWIDGKTTIALLGEFSAGKTSILNCILSNSDHTAPQLPIDIRPTTAIPTYISGGPINNYQFVTPNNELKELSETTFERVSKEILAQVEGVSSLIQYFVMTCKNDNLNKFSILDTPGFSSPAQEDAERTFSVINECDALFWVMNISLGDVTKSSLAILKKIAEQNKPLYIIINQIDLRTTEQLQQTEQQIMRTLQKSGIAYESILHFSKNRKETLTPLMNKILSIRHNDAREVYLDRITDLFNRAINKAKEELQKAEKEKNSARRRYDKIKNELEKEIDKIIEKNFEISTKPEKMIHLLSKDDYRLREDEYSKFKSLLNEANQLCDQLKDKFEELGQSSGEMARAIDKYHEAVNQVKLLEKCMDSLEDKVKELNRLSGKPATKARIKKSAPTASAPHRSSSRRRTYPEDEESYDNEYDEEDDDEYNEDEYDYGDDDEYDDSETQPEENGWGRELEDKISKTTKKVIDYLINSPFFK